MKANKFKLVLAIVSVALAFSMGACEDKKGSTCGNGKVGVEETCDCGTDPENLPPGCTAINGAPGSNCSETCERVTLESGTACGNGADDDDDGLTDCEDPGCESFYRCLDEECGNDIDDNGDGLTDCEDPDCASQTICVPEDCENGVDDNGDGHTDCQDEGCLGHASCEGVEVCWNGVDDDDDGNTDCDDTQCLTNPACENEENPTHDNCYDGMDNDGDGWVDCADPGCYGKPPCNTSQCQPDYEVNLTAASPFEILEGMDLSADEPADGDLDELCGANNSQEKVIRINTSKQGQLTVYYEQDSVHKFGLYFPAGDAQGCAQALHSCRFPQGSEMSSGVINYGTRPGGTYYLIVSEAVEDTGGVLNLAISLVEPGQEICGNFSDDDGDETTDCGDLDCHGEPDCVGSDCIPDADVGVLAPGEFFTTGVIDLNNYSSDNNLSCMALGGQDVVLGFSTIDSSNLNTEVQIHFDQGMDGGGDHALGLFFPGGTGTACDAAQNQCYDPVGVGQGTLYFGSLPEGQYFLVVKARPGLAGKIKITVSHVLIGEEICKNGIDDTGDGLTDCEDPVCDATAENCIVEQCGNGIDDDFDGFTDGEDDDPDDICSCTYVVDATGTCDGGQSGQVEHAPEIFYLGPCDGVDDGPWTGTLDFGAAGDLFQNDFFECESVNYSDNSGEVVLIVDVVEPNYDVHFYYDNLDQGGDSSLNVYHVADVRPISQCFPCDHQSSLSCLQRDANNPDGTWYLLDATPGEYAFIIAPDIDFISVPGNEFGKLHYSIECVPRN